MNKIALILSGCGYLDGAEIGESILILLALNRLGVKCDFFAPDKDCLVENHLTNKSDNTTRNVLIESARITRCSVRNLNELSANDFSAVMMPGGYGVAKNLSNLFTKGKEAVVIPDLKSALVDFWQKKKPIGSVCIASAAVVAALNKFAKITVTIGKDNDNLIAGLRGINVDCTADDYYCDHDNNIFSSPAYMSENPSLSKIETGINAMVESLVESSTQ